MINIVFISFVFLWTIKPYYYIIQYDKWSHEDSITKDLKVL